MAAMSTESRAAQIALFAAEQARSNYLNRVSEAQLAHDEMSREAIFAGIDADLGLARVQAIAHQPIAAGTIVTTGGIAAGQAIDWSGGVADSMPRPRRRPVEDEVIAAPTGNFLWLYSLDGNEEPVYLGGVSDRREISKLGPISFLHVQQTGGGQFVASFSPRFLFETICAVTASRQKALENPRFFDARPYGYGVWMSTVRAPIKYVRQDSGEFDIEPDDISPAHLNVSGSATNNSCNYSGNLEAVCFDVSGRELALDYQAGTYSVGASIANSGDYLISASASGIQFLLPDLSFPFSLSYEEDGGLATSFVWRSPLLLDQSKQRGLIVQAIASLTGSRDVPDFAPHREYAGERTEGVWLLEKTEDGSVFHPCNNTPALIFYASEESELQPPVAETTLQYELSDGFGGEYVESDSGFATHPLWEQIIGMSVIVSILDPDQSEGGTKAIKGFGTITAVEFTDTERQISTSVVRRYTAVSIEIDRVITVAADFWATPKGAIVSNSGSVNDLLLQLDSTIYYSAANSGPTAGAGINSQGALAGGFSMPYSGIDQGATWVGNKIYIAKRFANQPKKQIQDFADTWTMQMDESGVYQFNRAEQMESGLRYPLTIGNETIAFPASRNYYPRQR